MQKRNPDGALAGRLWLILLYLVLSAEATAQTQFTDVPALAKLQPGDAVAPAQVRVAIILDDLGYGKATGERAVGLSGSVTLAIIPFSPHARSLAKSASAAGKEYLVHVPMEPHNQVAWEADGLSTDLSRAELALALAHMLDAMPGAAGINNHMGSKFTENQQAVIWLMEELKKHQLFFVDSRTTAASVAWSTAQTSGIPSVNRDIFLDNDPTPAAIRAQLHKLVNLAQQRGQAVAIGHPRGATLDVLEAFLPTLQAMGVELVPVSALMASPITNPPGRQRTPADFHAAKDQ